MRQANYHAHYIDLDFMVRPKKRRLITFLKQQQLLEAEEGKEHENMRALDAQSPCKEKHDFCVTWFFVIDITLCAQVALLFKKNCFSKNNRIIIRTKGTRLL